MKNQQHALFEETAREICAENEAYVEQLYKRHRSKFIAWFMKRYQLNQEESQEVYHRSFLVLYYQIKDQKLTTIQSSLETYLFGIGKKLMLKSLRTERYFEDLTEVDMEQGDYRAMEREETLHLREEVKSILKNVAEPCKSILKMFYFHEFSLEAIAERLGYKNSESLKKKKSLCLKHIREQLEKKKD